MTDEQRRVAALERLVADQQAIIKTQRKLVKLQSRRITELDAKLDLYMLEVHGPGLWMDRKQPRKPKRGRPRKLTKEWATLWLTMASVVMEQDGLPTRKAALRKVIVMRNRGRGEKPWRSERIDKELDKIDKQLRDYARLE